MRLKNMLKQKIGWLEIKDDFFQTVISSRIRLARNLKGIPFTSRASERQQQKSFDRITSACTQSNYFKNAAILKLKEYDKVERQFFLERHLISYEHSRNDGVRGLVIGDKELLSIMINEEDHLRLQGMQPGFKLPQTWDVLGAIDDELGGGLDYAFSEKIGYLTACPTNTGTGMRASVLVHLPGLVSTDEIDKVLQALSRVGMVARGLYGEGTKVMGDLFQISNQVTLGPTEEQIVDNLEKIVKQIISYETNSRENLFKKDKEKTKDVIYRAYGLLSNVYRISFAEMMELLSKVRLGIYLGLDLGIPGVKKDKLNLLNELMILAQPSHLQVSRDKKLRAPERDIARAELIKKKIKQEEKIC
ncbi:protein arginine kinase [bacterium]|nr:protein arginine kinase [bacterium]